MEFHGLNKLTLLDFPKHLACTVFTGRCNLRCPFCHNADLVLCPDSQPLITEDTVFSFLERRAGTLEGICITGGEPTLQSDLLPFLKRCKDLGYLTKLDTNGTRPDVLKAALDANLLDYIAMDIKNSPARYAETAGLPSVRFSAFEESVLLIRNSGLPYEFRTTVVKELHTKEDLSAVGEWLKGAKCYALQAFKDSGSLIRPGLSGYTAEELSAFKDMLSPYFETVLLRGIA
ncbi:MAG: anaerobic ribonucleoside-triphosphate reductase activating protein [Lachnospiraceae bacterium]|nr:anaerobic ribonucleoside-triphosphate reductase activating protein [Lachnospiraceae bacterium]